MAEHDSDAAEISRGVVPSLAGKIALVTGGGRGLGRAMAIGLAAAGAEVIVSSRKLEACETVVDEIRSLDRTASARALHVGHWHELDGFVDQIYEDFGRLDVLVNNAGISPLYSSLNDISEELFSKVLDVNLMGPFRLSVLVGTRMKSGGGGTIINISSIAAINPTPAELPYAAAKAGLNAVTVGLAHEFGPSVRVNAIMCGPFLTDITKGWDFEAFDAYAARAIPLRRAGVPSEIIGSALYLATDMSAYTTGSILTVDGGSSRPYFSPAPSHGADAAAVRK